MQWKGGDENRGEVLRKITSPVQKARGFAIRGKGASASVYLVVMV